jgi:hypothetical protein
MAPPPVGSEIVGAVKGDDCGWEVPASLELMPLAALDCRVSVADVEAAVSCEAVVPAAIDDGSVGIDHLSGEITIRLPDAASAVSQKFRSPDL